MAIQSLTIKDGTGSIKYLAVESSSYGLIPIHQITSSEAAPIFITASYANPIPVTGNINVDVVVGDLINITASAAAPVYVTGVLTVNTGSSTVTVDSPVSVTSSNSAPLYVTSKAVTTVNKSFVNLFDWTIDNGAFTIADEDTERKGLILFNPGPYNLYVSLDTDGVVGDKGFIITDTGSNPDLFSFIVYASGTYFADDTTVGVYHAGYFISGSASDYLMITKVT